MARVLKRAGIDVCQPDAQPLVLALLFLPSGCLVGVLLIYPLVNGGG
jgi:hypothetical protein